MPLTFDEICENVIFYSCFHPFNYGQRDSGACFSASVKGKKTLVTAGHIPWKHFTVSPMQEQLQMSWSRQNGETGVCYPEFTPHTPFKAIDYARLDLAGDAGKASCPTVMTFDPTDCPEIGTAVVVFGFPDPQSTPPLKASYATGKILSVQTLGFEINKERIEYQRILTDTAGFFSGGPMFRLLEDNRVDEKVIGLASGKPSRSDIRRYRVPEGSIFFASQSFI